MKTILHIIIALMLGTGLTASAQQRTITGIVTDEEGNALPGVSITVDGTTRGCVSNIDGVYSLTVYPGDRTLLFSFIGYATQAISIGAGNRIDVVLVLDHTTLDEIIVTAYGEPENALQGRVSGVASSSIRIRGNIVKRERMTKSMTYPVMAEADAAYPVHNTEGYSAIHENGFKDVLQAPLSTFSVDVDRASYANVRRFLNMGQLPPMDAVRVEEMINYFNYDYPEPTGTHPFAVYTELSACPWNADHQLLHVGLQGKRIDKRELPASNLVFLIDVSGSMSDANKLPLLKQAFRMLVKELRPTDRVAMVVYAGAAGLVLESTLGSQKDKILAALDQLQSGGSTAGGAGLALAYKVARDHFIEGGNNRILLATDGDFNVGPSSNAEMERLVEKEREHGTFLTVLGFGMGNYKDDRMEIIADKGNGNYAYIDNLQEARKVFISEFGGTLFTIAKDVKFQIEFNPARVKGYRLVGYENRLLNDEDFNDDTKDAGEMGAGHTVTALYEIIPAGSDESLAGVDPLKYQEYGSTRREVRSIAADPSAELLTLKLRYKKPDGQVSTKVEIPVKGTLVDLEDSSDNFRFSASVAAFGLLLRNSEYKKSATWDDVIALARDSRGTDEEGYRSEFLKLVRLAETL